MKVKCIINRNVSVLPLVLPIDINKEFSDENFVVSNLESTGSITGYDLSIGRDYIVYGILEYDNKKRFLIQDDSNIPAFHSSKLFQIIDSSLDIEWGTKAYLVNNKQLIITSYCDILDYNSLIDLIQENPYAIKSFLDYKETKYD